MKNSRTFNKMNYFQAQQSEHLACRQNVALFDLTAFSKLEVKVCKDMHMKLDKKTNVLLYRSNSPVIKPSTTNCNKSTENVRKEISIPS